MPSNIRWQSTSGGKSHERLARTRASLASTSNRSYASKTLKAAIKERVRGTGFACSSKGALRPASLLPLSIPLAMRKPVAGCPWHWSVHCGSTAWLSSVLPYLAPCVLGIPTNFVEHPELVARWFEEAVPVVGDRERLIAGTDCGFGTFAGREIYRLGEARRGRQGTRIASHRLWGRARVRDAYGASVFLLRPDLHIPWRGDEAPPEPEALAALAAGGKQPATVGV
jgi:hypothetical protein